MQVRLIDTAVRWRQVGDVRRGVRFLGGSFQAIWDILRATIELVRWRPTAMHLCTSAGDASLKDLIIVKIARFFRVPVALHYHTSRLLQDAVEGERVWHLAKSAVMNANAVVVLDPGSESLLRSECPHVDIVRLPNPIKQIDLDEVNLFNSDAQFTIAFAGAVVPAKGIDLAVEACLGLHGVALKIIGPIDKKFRTSLEHRASARDGGNWLRFLGEMEREMALRELAASDLVILPSRRVYEAFPYVVLEAMALGKPVLATQVGALSEMLDIGTEHPCGVCVAPGDLSQLKNALVQLIRDDRGRQRMGQNGQRKVATVYAARAVVAELTQLWEAMANHRN